MRFLVAILVGAVLSVSGYQPALAQAMGNATVVAEALCGGVHRLKANGDFVLGLVRLRNIHPQAAITILRIRAWDRNGVALYDSDNDGLPGGSFKTTLQPFQSTGFNSDEIVPLGSRGLQVRITYSHNNPGGDPLFATTTTAFRIGSAFGHELARTSRECLDVDPA